MNLCTQLVSCARKLQADVCNSHCNDRSSISWGKKGDEADHSIEHSQMLSTHKSVLHMPITALSYSLQCHYWRLEDVTTSYKVTKDLMNETAKDWNFAIQERQNNYIAVLETQECKNMSRICSYRAPFMCTWSRHCQFIQGPPIPAPLHAILFWCSDKASGIRLPFCIVCIATDLSLLELLEPLPYWTLITARTWSWAILQTCWHCS